MEQIYKSQYTGAQIDEAIKKAQDAASKADIPVISYDATTKTLTITTGG